MCINAFLYVLRKVRVRHRRIPQLRLEGLGNSNRLVDGAACTPGSPDDRNWPVVPLDYDFDTLADPFDHGVEIARRLAFGHVQFGHTSIIRLLRTIL